MSDEARGRALATFSLPEEERAALAHHERPPEARPLPGTAGSVWWAQHLLSREACARWCALLGRVARLPVDEHGRREGFLSRGGPVGSYRATAYDPSFADWLWERLRGLIPGERVMQDETPTDWDGHRRWRAVGLNPLLRAIWYEPGGYLVPHYDAAFVYQDGRRTLMSLVLYLSPAALGTGGATRRVVDPQRYLPLGERVYHDWERAAAPHEILAAHTPAPGAALLLDHRVLHDAEAWRGPGPRVLLRTDVVYAPVEEAARAVPPPRAGALWAKLGLTPNATRAAIDQAGSAALARASTPAEAASLRYTWKLLRDPFYGPAYTALGSLARCEEAGYFDDLGPPVPDPRPADPRWMVTPLHKLFANLARHAEAERRLAVLLTTGGLCPPHPGHVALLENARAALEARGVAVLAGYLSPSHDAYVDQKCGDENPGAALRVALCEDAVRDSDWLMVDPWEALDCAVAVNFSEVIERLGRYLAQHVPTHRPIEVVYAFGSDNARFSLSFVARGACVSVPRPGAEGAQARYAADPQVRDNPRLCLDEIAAAPDLASRRVRAGVGTLSPYVEARWRALQTAAAPQPLRLIVRNEGRWALQPWEEGRDLGQLLAAWARFASQVEEALHEGFGRAVRREASRPLALVWRHLDAQRHEAARLLAGEEALSLDPCLPGAHNLGVSRGFALASDAPLGLVARPGWPSLEEQLAALPACEVVLFDDDRATGQTLAAVRARLPARVRVRRELVLHPLRVQGEELCDLRDFLAGAREAGLVVQLPGGGWARAPYLAPYVSLAGRLQVPRGSVRWLSRRLWACNRSFFARVRPAITLAEASPAFQALAARLGLEESTPLEEVCAWHLARLTE